MNNNPVILKKGPHLGHPDDQPSEEGKKRHINNVIKIIQVERIREGIREGQRAIVETLDSPKTNLYSPPIQANFFSCHPWFYISSFQKAVFFSTRAHPLAPPPSSEEWVASLASSPSR